MDCSQPPALTDDEISALLDNLADANIVAHIAHCAKCAIRFRRAKQIELLLRQNLLRSDCPTPARLREYHLGLLTATEERVILRHLEQCALCKAEIEDLRLFLSVDEPVQPVPVAPPPRQSQPRRGTIIARLLPQLPALALRGSGSNPLTAEANGATIFLDIQPTNDGRVTINGQLVAEEQEHWNGALVELWQAGALQATASLDDLGSFFCGPIIPGQSELRITPEQGTAIVLPDLDLKP